MLIFHQVSKAYRRRSIAWWRRTDPLPVLTDITFSIAPGEICGLIGVNGAGKSTLLKLAAGIIAPSSGSISFGEKAVSSEKMKRDFGYLIGTRSRLIWDLAPRDTFWLHRKLYGLSKSEYHFALLKLSNTFDLGPLLNIPVRSLSLGQRMRCEIALCLLHSPKLLLLDEATLSLDATAKDAFSAGIKSAAQDTGAAVLFASNEMNDVDRVASRLLFLHHGEIAYDGSTNDFIQKYGQGDVIHLKCDAPRAEEKISAAVSKFPQVSYMKLDGVGIDIMGTTSFNRADILRSLAPFIGTEIESINIQPATLNSVIEKGFEASSS